MAYPANAIIEVKVGYVANGQQCYNIVHYRPGNSGTGPVSALVDSLLGVIASMAPDTLMKGMQDLMSSDVTFNKLTGQCIWPTRYALREYTLGATVGDIDGRCNVQNVQMTFTKKGDLGNRHNVGSFHLGGLPDDLFQNGGFDEGTIAPRIAQMVAGLKWHPNDEVNAIEYGPVILNKTKTIVLGVTTYPITGSTIQTDLVFQHELRVMRRRTVGLGI